MRKNTLTFEEIQAAEKAAEDRRKSRNQGFAKMHERDRGVQLMSNGAWMLWHVNREDNKNQSSFEREDGSTAEIVVYPDEIPEDSFALVIEGKRYLFNLEEFRRSLRWA